MKEKYPASHILFTEMLVDEISEKLEEEVNKKIMDELK